MKQNSKDWIQYGSAIALIASAIILVFVCFLKTLDVTAGVNTYAGVAFSCALAIYGVAAYMVSQVASFKTDMRREFEDFRQELEDENKELNHGKNKRNTDTADSSAGEGS